jgi:hypothetical protein
MGCVEPVSNEYLVGSLTDTNKSEGWIRGTPALINSLPFDCKTSSLNPTNKFTPCFSNINVTLLSMPVSFS